MREYLTINEFAKAAGVSKQSIYQRLNTSLKKYSRVEQGKKVIASKALYEVYGINLEQEFQRVSQENGQDFQGNNQGLQQLIELLQDQLKAKDQQIEQLQNLLDQQQKLNMVDKQRICELEDKQRQEDTVPRPEQESEPVKGPDSGKFEEEPQRKGFFARLFGR